VFKKFIFLLPVCASVLPGCMSTPPLREATGVENGPPDIFIKDVVQRVKCELSDAFDKKTEQPEFLWLANWTAHADLTLQINDTAGIAPNGSYTKFQHSSINRDAGSFNGSGLPTTSNFPVVQQFFSLNASANLSGEAVRSETVSFTIALDELKRWRKQIDKTEAGFPPEKRSCNFDPSWGVTGNLGLKEWVDSAFSPVTAGQLEAGIHPQAGGGRPTSTSGPKTSTTKAPTEKSAVDPMEQVKQWQQTIANVQKATAQSSTALASASQKIKDADTTIKNNADQAKQFRFVLDPYVKAKYTRVSDIIKYYVKNVATCTKYKTDLDNAGTLASEIVNTGSFARYDELEELMTKKILSGSFEKDYADCTNVLQAQADAASNLPSALPNQVDPPIDSVLHSVNFVVSYGAGVSPSWSLLQWKGPGAGGTPLLSASGQRTHTLNLALGPRTGNPAISTDALRLITDQTIRNIGIVPGG
jgi:hypothetical protein